MSVFDPVDLAPADPILGLTEAFRNDPRPGKVNLGVGVYLDEAGKLPLMKCVADAERRLVEAGKPHAYLGIDGLPEYDDLVRRLVFGPDSPVVAEDRVVTVQTLGGTGALKLGGDFITYFDPAAHVYISDPSWENHRAIFAKIGFTVEVYRYYDAERRGINIEGMLADLEAARPGSVIVLHACCHNPTGYDLTHDQWTAVIEVVSARGLIPFLDMAYQGFGAGLTEDAAVISRFAAAGVPLFVSTSFSKSFGLYGERVGALHIVTADGDEARRVLSQVKICARTNYSNPAAHGAAIVADVLSRPDAHAEWERELGRMRTRIKAMRTQLVERLHGLGIKDMGFIADQAGMFSYSGLSVDQMHRLREEFAIYGTDAGRMCIAALNEGNLPVVAEAIAAVRS